MKYLNVKNILFVLVLFFIGFLLVENHNLKNEAQSNYVILSDSLTNYKNKVGELYKEKESYIIDNENLKNINNDLYKEIKNLKDNPIVITASAFAGSRDVTTDANSFIYADWSSTVLEASYASPKLTITGLNTSAGISKGEVTFTWKNENDFVYATKKFTYNIITENADYNLIITKSVINLDSTKDEDKLTSIRI